VTEPEFDRIVDPAKMVKPYVAEVNAPLAIGSPAS
jgi:fumarate hydratase class II